MELDRFQLLNVPLEAAKIIEIIEYQIMYHQTVISLPYRVSIEIWQRIESYLS